MTELDIIKILSDYTDRKKFPWQLATSFIYEWESDFWTMTSAGETREFEIKISRSDFLRDAKKDKHSGTTGANYFYYVCPADMIRVDEVPSGYGLIYVRSSGPMEIVKKPRMLNRNKFDRWKLLANKMYWKFRDLWMDKFRLKEITKNEYREGFNITLCEIDDDNPESNQHKMQILVEENNMLKLKIKSQERVLDKYEKGILEYRRLIKEFRTDIGEIADKIVGRSQGSATQKSDTNSTKSDTGIPNS